MFFNKLDSIAKAHGGGDAGGASDCVLNQMFVFGGGLSGPKEEFYPIDLRLVHTVESKPQISHAHSQAIPHCHIPSHSFPYEAL